jgi:NodT family efflux transporter outer membrane factor (OMF) lipoprotein
MRPLKTFYGKAAARLALLILALAAAGCAAVGPTYQTPKSALINALDAQGPFVGAKSASALSEAPLPAHWWRLYQSPVLDRLVAEALSANTDLRIADANLERSRAMVQAAKAAGQPKLSLGAGAQYTQLSAEQYLLHDTLPVFNVYDIGLSASYEVDLFGRIRRGVEAAKDDDEAVEAARDLVRISVAADVARAYAQVCGLGEELDAAHTALALQQQSLVFTQRLERAGRATPLDATRSQGQIDQFRANIPVLEATRQNALFRLATLTGKPPAAFEAGLLACHAAPRLIQPIPVGDGAALLKRRPDVRAAERRLAASTAEIGISVSALYPRVTLGGSLGSTGLIGDLLKSPTNFYGLGPGVSWELNHSAARARIAAAKASQKADLARFDGVVLTALRDVESALSTYSHDLDREQRLEGARDEAAKARADALRLQAAGRSNALTTLDAERTLAAADAALSALHAQLAQDQIALFLALGGGWETTAS